jgi:hypothetical protein
MVLCLIALLIGVYFITYNGYAISRDEWFLFDATESYARRGDFRLSYEYDLARPLSLESFPPAPAGTEPLQPALASVLFRAASLAPDIGLAHAVWLFNIFVTALTAAVVYAYGLALGYRARVAVIVAALYGLCTIAWPYSLTFFREPLFTLLGLTSALLVVRLRQRLAARQRPFLPLIALAVTLTGALLSKEAMLFLVPVLVLEALPSRLGRVHISRQVILVLIGVAVLGVVLALVVLNADTLLGVSQRYDLVNRLRQARRNLQFGCIGVKSYLFAPSYSVWIFSPVLVLGFFGWPRLIRERRARQILVPLVMLVVFMVGYALGRGEYWNGGIGWGARYLVPVTPFLALWLLPVVESLLEHGAVRWARVGTVLVALLSASIQVLAAVIPLGKYYATLNAQTPPVVNWREQLWSFRWSPIGVSLDLLGEQKADVAWRYATNEHAWYLPLFSALLVALALGAAGWWLRSRAGSWRGVALTGIALAGVMVFTLGAGLYVIRLDPRYYGDFAPTRDLLAQLEPNLHAGDVVLLNTDEYTEFFMNYYRDDGVPVYTLPLSPGERPSPEQPPEVTSNYADALVLPSTTISLAYFAEHYDRVWLVMETSSFIPWSTRPVEHYMARHYFPLGEIKATDTARAVAFSTVSAPPQVAWAWPDEVEALRFGEAITLVGSDLPSGTIYYGGETLPVSLLWGTDAPLDRDYTVALYVVSADGALIAQQDAAPDYGFTPTTAWQPGMYYRDNHAVQLPADLPPGTYEVWAAIYWWQEPGARLDVTTGDGTVIGDHAVIATVTMPD